MDKLLSTVHLKHFPMEAIEKSLRNAFFRLFLSLARTIFLSCDLVYFCCLLLLNVLSMICPTHKSMSFTTWHLALFFFFSFFPIFMIIFQQSHGARERVQLIRCFLSSSLRISRDFLSQIFKCCCWWEYQVNVTRWKDFINLKN